MVVASLLQMRIFVGGAKGEELLESGEVGPSMFYDMFDLAYVTKQSSR